MGNAANAKDSSLIPLLLAFVLRAWDLQSGGKNKTDRQPIVGGDRSMEEIAAFAG
jgi:hypothetical protein